MNAEIELVEAIVGAIRRVTFNAAVMPDTDAIVAARSFVMLAVMLETEAIVPPTRRVTFIVSDAVEVDAIVDEIRR